MVKEKEIKEENYKLIEVPTEMGLAIQTPDERQISQAELLVEIANKLDEILKVVQ